jgi:hypothetical protein
MKERECERGKRGAAGEGCGGVRKGKVGEAKKGWRKERQRGTDRLLGR